MPYNGGKRLGLETASKLGHLEIIKSELVNALIEQFEKPDQELEKDPIAWEPIEFGPDSLRLIFAVDGSK